MLKVDLLNEFNRKTPNITYLLDLKKASVWQHGLITKLSKSLHFQPHLCILLFSYTKGKTRILYEPTLCNFPVSIPQGLKLSAILFSCFTADISPLPADPNHIKILQYEDDPVQSKTDRQTKPVLNPT